jgi:hypothetical protein
MPHFKTRKTKVFLKHLNQHLCYNREAIFVASVPHDHWMICGLCCAQCARSTRNKAPYRRNK